MSDLKINMQKELAKLDFVGPNFTLTQFNGGTVNSSYKLESKGKKYFVKTFESDQISLLNRKGLFEIQQQLALKRLSVEPLYLSPSLDFQIDSWLDAPTLDNTNLSDLAICKVLAAALSEIHSSSISAPNLDLPSHWQHYIQQLQGHFDPPDSQTIDDMSQRWRRACDAKTVFCHNDLAISHVTNSQPAIVFDWEYCALSCPYFDIASCIIVNGLSTTDQASLCAHYAQCMNISLSDVKRMVEYMKPVAVFTYKLWYQSASLVE